MEFCRKSVFVQSLKIAFVAAIVLGVSHVRAAEKVAVISLKPTEQLFADVDYLLDATGMQGLGQFFLPQIKEYFRGVDSKQPIGVVVSVDQSQLSALAFLPVTDLDTVLSQLQAQLGEPVDAGNGILELRGPQPLYVKEQSGWAFFGQSKEALSELPANPAKLLEGLDKRYDVAVRAYIGNIPKPYKQMAVDQIQQGLQRGLAEADDLAAREMAEAQVAQLSQLIKETDVLTIGWRIDSRQQETHFDIAIKAVAGSDMEKQIDAARNMKTGFGGFLAKDSALQANLVSVLLTEQIDEAVLNLRRFEESAINQIENEGALDNRTRAAAKELTRTFFRIAQSTVETGKFDACISLVLKPNAFTLIAAGHVASGSEVETALKQLVAMAENESAFSFSNVRLNADEHAGVRFHTLAVPIPDEQSVRDVLGDTLNIVVGVSDTSAYLALGTDGLDYLKKSIDASAGTQETVDPFHLDVAVMPILKFAQSIGPNPMVDTLIQMVGASDGKDHIRVRTSVDDEGLLYRIELEEGVLRVLGQAGQMVGAGGF